MGVLAAAATAATAAAYCVESDLVLQHNHSHFAIIVVTDAASPDFEVRSSV
jgi:hypothetical protein